MQLHGQRAGHVVVASAGELQAIRRARLEARRRVLANHHQRLQRLGYSPVRQAVIAMTTLHMQANERQFLESGQVRTGS
ncbi:hypothetical protein D3C86_1990030 [compost metagenome]